MVDHDPFFFKTIGVPTPVVVELDVSLKEMKRAKYLYLAPGVNPIILAWNKIGNLVESAAEEPVDPQYKGIFSP